MNKAHEILIARSNSISFAEEEHIYTSLERPDTKFISGTTIISQFHEHFNAERIATKLAKGDELKKALLICEWACSSPKGSYIHKLAELYCLSLQKKYEFPINFPNQQFQVIASYIDSFMCSGWEILQPEMIIFDFDLKICGMADLLVYNSAGEIMILDFKTCKSIPKTAFDNKTMENPISHLPDTKFNHYALQLSLYQYMIEKNIPSAKIVGRILIQSSADGNRALIQVPYLKKEIISMLQHLNLKQ